MRVLLRDLAAGQEYAIQFRSVAGELASEWSQVQRFTTTNDTVRPGNVANLSFTETGDAHVAVWDKVVVDEAGNPLRDFRHYRVEVTYSGSSVNFTSVGERFELSREANIAAFGQFRSALSVKVWAVDLTYNESLTPASATVNPAAPPTPSAPTVGTYLGSLMVSWDGLNSSGTAMPTNLNFCEVHLSTASGFTPSINTLAGRLFAEDGAGAKLVLAGLTYGTTYYVRLIAVNLHNLRSNASAQGSNAPVRITGLDIQNGQIGVNQINFTARDIGGANAFYQTTQPTSGMKSGDIWYDTDNGYTTYRFDGSAWVAAPEIGVIAGTKILTGTLTADAVGTNLLIASSANIADAIIDSAKISNLSVAKLVTGAIAANQEIIAGDVTSNHARMTSTGFYVKGPGPDPGDGTAAPIVDRIRMGTGVSDFFAIPDPVSVDSTLAQIDENGIASFQAVHAANTFTLAGQTLDDILWEYPRGTIGGFQGSHANNVGLIETPYGACEANAHVETGRSYRITFQLTWRNNEAGNESYIRVHYTTDGTRANINSPILEIRYHFNVGAGGFTTTQGTAIYNHTGPDTEMQFLLSIAAGAGAGQIDIIGGREISLIVDDLGPIRNFTGALSSGGGTLYQATTSTPPPEKVSKNFYWESKYNWVRSYKGDNSYMTNTNGRGYQGLDPSGYNGNQSALYGWTHDIATMLDGAYNVKIHLYLYFSHWYYNSGGTARVGYHNRHLDPGTAARPATPTGVFDVSGFTKPGGKTFDISKWKTQFDDGSARGISLGPGNNGFHNYGYATDAKLKIWYTKDV